MKAWLDAEYLVAPSAPLAPLPELETAVHLAAREYFMKSLAWVYYLDTFPSEAGESEYDVLEVPNTEIVKVLAAHYDGYPLLPLTAADFQGETAKGNSGAARAITNRGGTMLIHPAPADDGRTILVQVALRPSLSARGLDDDLWNEHIDRIAPGAIARILEIPGRQYTSPNDAMKKRGEFLDEINRASVRAMKARTRARMPGRPRFY